MPTFRYSYFNVKGRGEIPRLLFAAAGQKYEEELVEPDQWPERKKSCKLGTLPILTVDGREVYQSLAICRYLARIFNLYGHDTKEMCQVDQVLDCVVDIREALVTAVRTGKEEEIKKMMENIAIPMMRFFEELYTKNNKSQCFIIGNKLAVADLAIYDILDKLLPLMPQEMKDKLPRLLTNSNTVKSDPRVGEYIKNRKETAY